MGSDENFPSQKPERSFLAPTVAFCLPRQTRVASPFPACTALAAGSASTPSRFRFKSSKLAPQGCPTGRAQLGSRRHCACAQGSRASQLKTLAPLKTFSRPEETRLRTAHQWRSTWLRQPRPGAVAPTPGPRVRSGPNLPQPEVTTIPRRTEAGFISAPFCLPRKRLVGAARKRRDKLPRVQHRQWNREMRRRRGCRRVCSELSLVPAGGSLCSSDHAVTLGRSQAGIG